MSNWTLDYCANLGRERFATVATKSSGDACKTEAKRRSVAGDRGVYRIYDPLARLVWFSQIDQGNRMRWHDGGPGNRATMFDGVEWPEADHDG